MTTVKFKLPSVKKVEFSLSCEPEHVQINGNCSAIDEETDKANEDWIINELNNGNEWAWCTVKVTASYKGQEGNAYLGCCSYKSRSDFMKDGYYKDMKDSAYNDLIDSLKRLQD